MTSFDDLYLPECSFESGYFDNYELFKFQNLVEHEKAIYTLFLVRRISPYNTAIHAKRVVQPRTSKYTSKSL